MDMPAIDMGHGVPPMSRLVYGGYACEAVFGEALQGRADLKKRMQIVTKCDIMLLSDSFPDRRVKYTTPRRQHVSRRRGS